MKGIAPEKGHHYDDTRRYIDSLDLSPADREKVFHGNVRKVYKRFNKGRES